MSEEKRKTVNIRNGTGRPLMLHLHETIPDDGGGRPFQGRLLSSQDGSPITMTLRGDRTDGVDKEFFDKWREQNKGSDLLALLTAEDENEPESAPRAEG